MMVMIVVVVVLVLVMVGECQRIFESGSTTSQPSQPKKVAF